MPHEVETAHSVSGVFTEPEIVVKDTFHKPLWTEMVTDIGDPYQASCILEHSCRMC